MPGHISGAMRFSVESLLYYAPQVTMVGTGLAEAVAAVQSRLADLGDFFGDSWPDQPFRDSYPRCQYAMLIIARQLADEIAGIGGGIEQMARTYGVAEDQNAADIARIRANQDRISSVVDRSFAGPQPPYTPLKVPVPPQPAVMPCPRANPAPVPPTPAATLSAYVSETPSASPTPSPQPGADPSAWHQADDVTMLGPWPTGDPARLDEAATCWTTLQYALDAAWTDLRRYAAYVLADTRGPAADAFSDYVKGLTAPGNGSLTRAIEMAEYLRDACLHQAEEITVVRRQIEQTAIEFLAALVVTEAVAVLTFGSVQEVAAAVEAGTLPRLSAAARSLARNGTRLAGVLNTAAEGMAKGWAAAVTGGMQGAIIDAGTIGADNFIGLAFEEKPAGVLTDFKAAATNGFIGALLGQGSAGGLLGLSAALASKKLIDLGEMLKSGGEDKNGIAAMLTTMGTQLKDGGITVSIANATLSQLIADGKITPVGLISGAVANRFTTLISPHTGKHVAD